MFDQLAAHIGLAIYFAISYYLNAETADLSLTVAKRTPPRVANRAMLRDSILVSAFTGAIPTWALVMHLLAGEYAIYLALLALFGWLVAAAGAITLILSIPTRQLAK